MTTTIRLKVDTVEVDQTNYKQVKPVLRPEEVYVEIKLKDQFVNTVDDDGTFITPEGLYNILKQLAKAQDKEMDLE